jgi:hypothetical protein
MRYISIKKDKKVRVLNFTKAAVYIGVSRRHLYNLEKLDSEITYNGWIINFDTETHFAKYS